MATINALVKIATSQYGMASLNIMFARYNIALLISLPLFYIMATRKCNIWLHLLRGGFLFAGHFCVYQGFKYSNFITATLINMTEPLIVILLSVLIFKRKQTWLDIGYMLLGFSGALLLVFTQAGITNHTLISYINITIPHCISFNIRSDILGFLYILSANIISATGVFICKEIADKEDWTTVVFYTTSILWLFGLSIGSTEVYTKVLTVYNMFFFVCIILLILIYGQYRRKDIYNILANNSTLRHILLLDAAVLMLFWILVYSFCYYSNFVFFSHILFLVSFVSWLLWTLFEFTLSDRNFYIFTYYYNIPLHFYNLRLYIYEHYLNISNSDVKLIQNINTIHIMLVIPLYCILIPSVTGLSVSELKLHHIMQHYKAYMLLFSIGTAAFISHFTIAKSLALLKPETFASFQYLRIVFSFVLSFIFFNQLPNAIQIIGACIILFSIFRIHRNKKLQIQTNEMTTDISKTKMYDKDSTNPDHASIEETEQDDCTDNMTGTVGHEEDIIVSEQSYDANDATHIDIIDSTDSNNASDSTDAI